MLPLLLDLESELKYLNIHEKKKLFDNALSELHAVLLPKMQQQNRWESHLNDIVVWGRNNDGHFLVYFVRFIVEHGRYGMGGRS